MLQDSPTNRRVAAAEGSTAVRSVIYLVVITALTALLVMVVTYTRFSSDQSLHNPYVLWGSHGNSRSAIYAQEWGLEGKLPWRAKIILRGPSQ